MYSVIFLLLFSAATPPPPSSDPSSQHDQPPSTPPQDSPHRSNSNDNDDAEDEPASINVLPTLTLQLWSGLLERRGYQIADGEVILSPSKKKADPGKKQAKPPDSPRRAEIPARESVISSFRRANSFAPVAREEAGSLRQIPFKRAATSAVIFAVHDAQAGPSTPVITPPRLDSSSKRCVAQPADSIPLASAPKMFTGMSFRVLGEANCPTVRQAIEEQGGRICSDEEEVTFIIVRLVRSAFFLVQHDISHVEYPAVGVRFTGRKIMKSQEESIVQNVGWSIVSLRRGYVLQKNKFSFFLFLSPLSMVRIFYIVGMFIDCHLKERKKLGYVYRALTNPENSVSIGSSVLLKLPRHLLSTAEIHISFVSLRQDPSTRRHKSGTYQWFPCRG